MRHPGTAGVSSGQVLVLQLAGSIVAAAAIAGLGTATVAAEETPKEDQAMQIVSSAFAPGGEIPGKYTCEGADVSPPLAWSDLPAGTKSLALIVDDPDAPDPKAPRMVWVHWILYNIPPDAAGLAEAVGEKNLPKGTLAGVSDFRRTAWGGPCPPIGRHRYFFKLYALDAALPDLRKPTKAQLLGAMEGHVLAQAELIGTYQKKK